MEALVSGIIGSLSSIIQGNEPAAAEGPLSSTGSKLTEMFRKLQSVAVDAEQRQITDDQVRNWVNQTKDICYELEDVLDDWKTAVLKHRIEEDQDIHIRGAFQIARCFLLNWFPLCSCLTINCDEISEQRRIHHKLKSIIQKTETVWNDMKFLRLEEQLARTRTSFPTNTTTSTSIIDTECVWGREEETVDLVNKVVYEEDDTAPNLQFISIVGMGGIGKTTLAKLVYAHNRVKFHFDVCIWVSVSQDFDVEKIANATLESYVYARRKLHRASPDSVLDSLAKMIQGIKLFLVLDDVWEADYIKWKSLIESLQAAKKGSRVLLTTRNEIVAYCLNSMYTYKLSALSMDESWAMFSQIALQGFESGERGAFQEIGMQIVKSCRGMPSVVQALASMLRFRKNSHQWLEVLHRNTLVPASVTGSLLISYNDMPAELRVCFCYWAVFPKNSKIEKRKLIKLWMAQGYCNIEAGDDLEAVGEHYIYMLVMRSMLQLDLTEQVVELKMHDLLHDLAKMCSGGECLVLENDDRILSPQPQTRHVSLLLSNELQIHEFEYFTDKHKKLRSLLLQSRLSSLRGVEMETVLSNLFTKLTHLRSLDLNGCTFRKLPTNVKNLVYLRLLILSMNEELEELPEEICDLYNLQTLEVNWCESLKGFPKGMTKLVRLRHLGNLVGSRKVSLPKGIGSLTSLRTLLVFSVIKGDETASLAELRNLKQLQGHICIDGLGDVMDVDEVHKAQLNTKEKIFSVELNFQGDEEQGSITATTMARDDKVVIEALQPQRNLEKLKITGYQGLEFPPWMLMLWNLRKITLLRCDKCVSLPPLGKLLCLEELVIQHMALVELVGQEFLGMDYKSLHAEASPSSSSVVAFPALVKLEIGSMPLWEKWSDWSSTWNATIMPKLRSLCIEDCPKLEALPDWLLRITGHVEMTVNGCPLSNTLENIIPKMND